MSSYSSKYAHKLIRFNLILYRCMVQCSYCFFFLHFLSLCRGRIRANVYNPRSKHRDILCVSCFFFLFCYYLYKMKQVIMNHQPKNVHCWTQASAKCQSDRFRASHIPRVPVTFTRSLAHLVGGLPTLGKFENI